MSAGRPVRLTLAALAFAAAAVLAVPAGAQTTVNPPEGAATAPPPSAPPAAMWERVRQGEAGRSSLTDPAAARLIQAEALVWRDRNVVPVKWAGIAVLGATVLGVLVFWVARGPVRGPEKPAGRRVERFGHAQRLAHWLVGLSFILLALSGFTITYGRMALLPFVEPETFALVALGAKLVHNFVGPAFAAGLVMMAVLWGRHALFAKGDGTWLARGGGLLSRSAEPPAAGRLNAGQKLLFWLTILGGGALTVSGAALLFPFAFTDVYGMQAAQLGHVALAIAMTAMAVVHLYFGTVGFQGSFRAAGSGVVDRNWAGRHHSEWMREVRRAERQARKAEKEAAAAAAAAESDATPPAGETGKGS